MTKTLIAIPCMDMVHTAFMSSLLGLARVDDTRCGITVSSLTYDARNTLAAQALDSGCDRILWIDSDMTFRPDLMRRLSDTMTLANLDYLSAVCVKRRAPITPVIYEKLTYEKTPDGIHSLAVPVKTLPKQGLLEIAASGLGVVMMTTRIVKDVFDHYGPPFTPMMGLGEDLSFCWRAAQLGYKMFCDTGVKVGHMGLYEYTDEDWRKTAHD